MKAKLTAWLSTLMLYRNVLSCFMFCVRTARRNLAWQRWSFLSKWKWFQLHLAIDVFSGISTTTFAILQATSLVTTFAWRMTLWTGRYWYLQIAVCSLLVLHSVCHILIPRVGRVCDIWSLSVWLHKSTKLFLKEMCVFCWRCVYDSL